MPYGYSYVPDRVKFVFLTSGHSVTLTFDFLTSDLLPSYSYYNHLTKSELSMTPLRVIDATYRPTDRQDGRRIGSRAANL